MEPKKPATCAMITSPSATCSGTTKAPNVSASSAAPKRILHLILIRQWFDEMASGRKTEEYRRKTLYWLARLCEDKAHNFAHRTFDTVHFRNGYNKNAPTMTVEFNGIVEKNHEHYGPVFAIQLGKILEIKR